MIKQAIIPLAGLGTRMLPLTSVIPKELLPINGKPNLEYILEECLQAGINEFIFIISKKKNSIKKYFFNDIFYKQIIKKKGDKRIIEEFKKIKKYQKMIKFVYQNHPRGTGDAVLKCKKYIKGNYFLILILFFEMMNINSFIPASRHSSIIYSKFGLPFIGSNSFGITLVKGNNLVPSPAKGIIACFII